VSGVINCYVELGMLAETHHIGFRFSVWLFRQWSSWPWSLVPKIAGLLPAEAVRFFGWNIPKRAFLWKGSKAVCPMSPYNLPWKSQIVAKLFRHLSPASIPH
jgi:hypothetical protein